MSSDCSFAVQFARCAENVLIDKLGGNIEGLNVPGARHSSSRVGEISRVVWHPIWGAALRGKFRCVRSYLVDERLRVRPSGPASRDLSRSTRFDHRLLAMIPFGNFAGKGETHDTLLGNLVREFSHWVPFRPWTVMRVCDG